MKTKTAAEILLTTCSDCKPGEKILFVTDPYGLDVARMMWEASGEYPERTLIMMNERTMHGQEPTRTVAAAMREADVVFGITKYSLFHSQARKEAVGGGARFVNMVDYRPEMMQRGGLFADFDQVGRVCARVAERLTEKKTCRITTKNGTDFICSIENRKPLPQFGRSLRSGDSSSPPDIECAICAVEGTGNGIVCVDGSIPHPLLGLIHDRVVLTISDGQITGIAGGKQAEIFRGILADVNDPNAYVIGEIGIGLNPMCALSGSMLEDEGCGGTVHLACGDNTGFGGSTGCAAHIDMILREPTVYVDGEAVLQNGEVCISEKELL